MQKKVVCLILALVMLLGLSACSENGSSEPAKGETVGNGTYSGVEKTSDTSFVSDSKSENGYDLTFVCAADQVLAEQGKLMSGLPPLWQALGCLTYSLAPLVTLRNTIWLQIFWI